MEPIRNIIFSAAKDGLTPNAPQYAGVQGEHNATQVTFQLDAGLTILGGKYRIEYVDSTGQQDTTDFLPSSSGKVSCLLPKEWTSNGGIAEIRLVIASQDASTQETQTMITLAGKLYYADKYGCNRTDCIQKGLSELIEEAHDATADAAASAESANIAADGALAATADAAAATQAANTAAAAANAAAQDASHFYTLAQEQAEIATAQAGIALSQAEAALTHSEAASAEAGKAATSAARAQTAQTAAEAAQDAAQTALGEVNGLAEQVAADRTAVAADRASAAADKAAASDAKTGAEAALTAAVEQAERAETEADRAAAIDAYTKGASDSRYLRSTVVEEPMTGGTAVLADADDGALASLRIEGVTRETGSGDKGPENPYTLSGVSPSIVRASGKNLFDNSGGWNPMTSGNDTVSNTSSGCQISSVAGGFGASTAALFPVTPGQTYTISGRWEQTTDYIAPVNGLRLNFYRTAERVDAQLGTQWKYTQKQQDISGTDTVPDGCYYAAINFYTGFSATQPVNGTLSNVQLEFGTAPTAYEPYRGKTVALPPIAPLYSLPDGTHDEYDPATGVEIRRVGAVELQNRPWAPYTPDGTVQDTLRSSVENGLIGYSTGTLPYCTHSNYDYQRWLYPDKGVGLTGPWTASSFIGWSAPGITPESFSAWLTAQKEAGTPVTVLYRLEKPVMTQHDPQTVPTYRENTSLQLDASAPGLLRYPLSSVMQWDAKQDRTEALRRYAPALTGEASGAVAAVSDAATGFLMQRAAATGVTIETGTGGKAPENPYALSGAEPSKVVVCGKNLLGFEDYTYSTNTTSRVHAGNEIVIKNIHTSAVSISVILDGQAIGSLFTGTFGAGTYTFSVQFEGAATLTAPRLQLAYSDGTLVTCNSGQPVTLTHPAAVTGIRCNPTEVASGVSVTTRLQFEKGPTATEIEPYTGAVYPLPALEPLYGLLDGTGDEYDAVTGVEIRRTAIKVFDGTEKWELLTSSVYAKYTYSYYLTGTKKADGKSVCSHFVNKSAAYSGNVGKPGMFCDHPTTYYKYFVTDKPTVDEWKAWLAEQYAAGTPLTIVYELNTPIVTQHDPQDITQPEAAMSVLADGGAEMDIRYSRDPGIALLNRITALEAALAALQGGMPNGN